MLLGREFSSHLRRYPREKTRPQWRRIGFRTPFLGLRDRFRRLGEPRAGFQVGLRHPVAKIAVAAFVVLDLILVYRLTASDSPALIAGVPESGGVHTASRTTFDELREALADLNVRVSALKLFGGDAGRGTRQSTSPSGGDTSQVTSTSGGSPTGSGGSASGSGSGGSSTDSGTGGSTDGGSTGGGGGGGSAGGGGTDDGGGSGGGGGGGGP